MHDEHCLQLLLPFLLQRQLQGNVTILIAALSDYCEELLMPFNEDNCKELHENVTILIAALIAKNFKCLL